MALVFSLIGLFVQIIFLMKRDRLFSKQKFNLILMVSLLLFVIAYLLIFNYIGNVKYVKMLTVPFMSVLIFSVIRFIFFRIYKRNAEDTFWSMEINQITDGVFNFIFLIVGTIMPIIIAYKFLP
jgi:hypothetical protein